MHWLGRHRRLVLAAICGSCRVRYPGASSPGFPFVSAIWPASKTTKIFCRREGRKTATRDDFVFLGIDQSTLELPPFAPEELAE